MKLTWGLKLTQPARIEAKQLEMQLKRTMARIEDAKPRNYQQWLDLIDTEYTKMVETLNEWSQCRQEWLELKRASLIQKWERTEMRARLQELEAELEFQRRQWRLLTQQFA